MKPEAVTFEHISKLLTQPKDSYYLIDVRSLDEVKNDGKIKHTTVVIPISELEQNLELSDKEFKEKHYVKKPPSDADLVFTCRSGRRAMMGAEIAVKLGFTRVKSYAGSFLDWRAKDGPIA